MFLQEASVCNFADDNSLSSHAKSLLQVISINSIAANPKKFQLMFLGKIGQINDIENIVSKSKSCVKLLGTNIEHKLNFSEHVKTLCKSASGKIKALFRIRHYFDHPQCKNLSLIHI